MLKSLVGKRISVLYKLHGDSEHPFSEAVGVVKRDQKVGDDRHLVLVKRNAEEIELSSSDIVKLKVIPTPPIARR